jgi:hypothetical protein
LEEDLLRTLAKGVIWRRRRFRFLVQEEDGRERPEALCINEVTLDSNAEAEIRPTLAAMSPELMELAEVQNAYWATTFAAGAIRDTSAKRERETRLFLNLGYLYFEATPEQQAELKQQLAKLSTTESASESLLEALELLDPVQIDEPAGGYGIARYLPAFPVSRLVQASERVLAATNGGYFLNFPEEYDDGISALHQPVGGHMVDGRLLMPPWIERPGMLHFTSGRTTARLYAPEDVQLRVEGLPPVPLHRGIRARGEVNGTTWRAFDGTRPATPGGVVQISFTGTLLVDVSTAAEPLRAPLGGATVWLTGAHAEALRTAANPAAIARVELAPQKEGTPDWMVSAGPFLVQDNRVVLGETMLSPANAGEFRPGGPPPTRFPYDTDRTAAPRTAIGTTATGGHKLVVVDGRRSGEHSCGLTLDGLAYLMKQVGCEFAMNLDGGGSSVMAIEGAGYEDMLQDNTPLTVVNIPSDGDGRERIGPIFLMVNAKSG